MAVGSMIHLVFLMFSITVSGSNIGTKYEMSEDTKDFFTKKVQELSATELTGIPHMGWKPMDPFQFQYNTYTTFRVYEPPLYLEYDFYLTGSMTGSSNFTASDIRIIDDPSINSTSIKFVSTTGPINLKGRYVVYSYNQKANPHYEGTFELTSNSTTRNQRFTTSSDGSYFVSDYSCTYSSVLNYSLIMSDLPANLTKLVNAMSPSDILTDISRAYFSEEMMLFSDIIRHPDSRKRDELNQHLIKHQHISPISGKPNKIVGKIGDVKGFFTKKVQELSSTELKGFPTTGWKPIDPSETSYYKTMFSVKGPDFWDYIYFRLMSSLTGSSNFSTDNIEVDESPDHSVSVKFNATTGPIYLTGRYFVDGRLNGTFIPIYEGSLELTADSAKRARIVEVEVASDGTYFVNWYRSSPWTYSSVTNLSFNISNLPDYIVELVKAASPERMFSMISDSLSFEETFLFNDMIRY